MWEGFLTDRSERALNIPSVDLGRAAPFEFLFVVKGPVRGCRDARGRSARGPR
jgi:hypothetical protein